MTGAAFAEANKLVKSFTNSQVTTKKIKERSDSSHPNELDGKSAELSGSSKKRAKLGQGKSI